MSLKLNNEIKIEICDLLSRENITDREICNKFQISKDALYRIKSNMDEILTKKCSYNSETDKSNFNNAIYDSFCRMREKMCL